MLYFSKIKILSVIIFTLVVSYFSVSNFFKFDDELISRNINLGLDLQGGSYLLLEIDNQPVVVQKLQLKLIQIKEFLKEKNIKFKNITIKDNNKIPGLVLHSINEYQNLESVTSGFEQILVLSIEKPGLSGQKFYEKSLICFF